MKSLTVLASILALLCLLGTVVGVRGMRGQWLLVVYLSAQLAFTVTCWLEERRLTELKKLVEAGMQPIAHPHYRQIYAIMAILPLATALLLVFRWLSFLNFDAAATAVCVAIVVPCGMSTAIASYQHDAGTHMHLVIASVFAACGMASLVCALGVRSHAEMSATLMVSAFWLLQALYLYGIPAKSINPNLAWIANYGWFGPVSAIVIFSLLAWKLSRGQFEGSRETFHLALQHVQHTAGTLRSMVR